MHDGHLKKFGSTGPFVNIDEIKEDGYISTSVFFSEYVEKKVPLLFRNEAKKFTAYKLWLLNDEYFIKKTIEYGADYYVNVETVKKESRDQQLMNMTFLEFLNIYNKSDVYLVNDVPSFLKSNVQLPTVLQCAQAPQTLEQTIMWFSSGGTKSVTHTDDYENILCLFAGQKTFILVDAYKYDDIVPNIIDIQEGSYSSMDVDRVNYTNYQGLDTVDYYKVVVNPGDCLYLPFKWIHQVDSVDRNIAVNFWFNYEKIFYQKEFPTECEANIFDMSKTLDKYTYSRDDGEYVQFRYFILRQINYGIRKLDQWRDLMKKELGDGYDMVDAVEFSQITQEIFDLLDTDGSGYIDDSDLHDVDEKRLDLLAKLFEEMFSIVNSKLDEDDNENMHDEF